MLFSNELRDSMGSETLHKAKHNKSFALVCDNLDKLCE